MKRIIAYATAVFFFVGCAKIPVQSVALADALQEEGERMHKLNIVLLNRIFTSKRDGIEKFVQEEYTPKVIELAMAEIKESEFKANLKKDLPEFVQALTPAINAKRDSMVRVLELQKEKLVDKLNTDYKVFDDAATELKRLLESAVKVDRNKQAMFNQAKTLSNNRLDFNSIEDALNQFIKSAGNVGKGATDLEKFIDRFITSK